MFFFKLSCIFTRRVNLMEDCADVVVHSISQCHHIPLSHVRLGGEAQEFHQFLTSYWGVSTHQELSPQVDTHRLTPQVQQTLNKLSYVAVPE